MQSPRSMMDKRIDAAVSAGSISTEDQTALDSALDAIDSALSTGSAKQASRLAPADMKERIDSLIDGQVSAGTLTEDQATELRNFFAQGPSATDGSTTSETGETGELTGIGGTRGMRPMGPPPGPPPGGSDDESSSDDETSVTDQLDTLIAFLEQLRQSLSSDNSYGLAGSTSNSSTASGLVVDQLA
jgi:hypothetical protein